MRLSRGLLFLGLLIAGCGKSGHFPNPNDPADVGALSPDLLRSNYRSVTEALAERRANNKLSTEEYKALIAKAADEMLSAVDPNNVPPDQAWQYAEVLRDARQWDKAERVLTVAVKFAKETRNADRFVNDSLRLAVVRARQGKVQEAIETARTTLGASPRESAPILVAVLLELAPISRGKGQDYELAKLLVAAIGKHMATIVDPNTDAGKAFLMARPFHVRHAWYLASELYGASGHPKEADDALKKGQALEGNNSVL